MQPSVHPKLYSAPLPVYNFSVHTTSVGGKSCVGVHISYYIIQLRLYYHDNTFVSVNNKTKNTTVERGGDKDVKILTS